MRGLIKPPPGFGLALIDFVAQEVGLAAGLSGDERLAEAYLSGDPYLAFAKDAGLVPGDATKESHTLIRERCKQVVLGVNYGMGIASMAEKADISPAEAASLLRRHKETYRKFWRWLEGVVDGAMLTNEIHSVFGWRRRIGVDPNPCSIMNFPMQANGAETLRIAAIAGTEAGIEVCAPIHDAFLIAAPLQQLDEQTDRMRRLMTAAGSAVTGGLPINTEAKIIRYPDRYMDDRVQPLWDKVKALLTRRHGGAAA
jgi:DNA polymerase I-like protein with 3'-5' exonuclease and polymerase domains